MRLLRLHDLDVFFLSRKEGYLLWADGRIWRVERSGTAAVGDAASTALSSHGLQLSEVVSGRPSKQSPDPWQSED